jgi:hypothetical protein
MFQCYKRTNGKTLGKRPLGRPRRRWKGNIKVGLRWGNCPMLGFNVNCVESSGSATTVLVF